MPGGFPLGLDICNGTSQGIGSNQQGTSIPTGALNTMGAWTQIIASLPSDCCFIDICFDSNITSNGIHSCGINLGVGSGGSQQIIVGTITQPGNQADQPTHYAFPLHIPSGTTVWAQAQGPATDHVAVSFTFYDAGFTGVEGYAGADGIGFVAGSSDGTSLTPSGTGGTPGSYAVLTASTTRDYCGFILCFDSQNTTLNGTTLTVYNVDIAIGATGSEQIIIPKYMFANINSGTAIGDISSHISPLYPVSIPSGTKISARITASTTTVQGIGLCIAALYQ